MDIQDFTPIRIIAYPKANFFTKVILMAVVYAQLLLVLAACAYAIHLGWNYAPNS